MPSVSCGGAGEPMCFMISYAELEYASGGFEEFTSAWENAGIAWQGATPPCLCVQTQSATWGRVKGLYR